MLLVGLTGGIGAGKSTVAELLVRAGRVLVDADVVARAVVEPGEPALDQLVERFGPGVVGADGRSTGPRSRRWRSWTTNRASALEAITHPAINEEFLRRVTAAPADAIVVHDVPLLVESALAQARGYEVVIVVEAPRELRLDRLEERGLTRADAEARMAAQATDEERRKVATYVVDNGGDRAHLDAQIARIWTDLERRLAENAAKAAQAAADEAE